MSTQQQSGRQTAGKKSSMGSAGHSEKASPAAVERYLHGIDYPTNKNGLSNCARHNGAPEGVMHVIGRLKEQEYRSPIDVSKAMAAH